MTFFAKIKRNTNNNEVEWASNVVAHEEGEIYFSFIIQQQNIFQPRLIFKGQKQFAAYLRNRKTFDLLDQFINTEQQYLKIHKIITKIQFSTNYRWCMDSPIQGSKYFIGFGSNRI